MKGGFVVKFDTLVVSRVYTLGSIQNRFIY